MEHTCREKNPRVIQSLYNFIPKQSRIITDSKSHQYRIIVYFYCKKNIFTTVVTAGYYYNYIVVVVSGTVPVSVSTFTGTQRLLHSLG